MHRLIYSNIMSHGRKALILMLCLVTTSLVQAQTPTVRGKVTNERGEPVPGATIAVKGTTQGTTSDGNGAFIITPVNKNASLLISSVGYEEQEIAPDGRSRIMVTLKQKANKLDETVVMAYGTTTKRLNTGNIGKVSAEEIGRQPVSNPLAALEGRVPGMVVTQSSGVPGSAFKVRIRGQSSLAQGSEPLFIIDGVPFAANNNSVNALNSALGLEGLSPFNAINPNDIESIEVLKDADATAIYGSRGANGVILITTKKGKPGETEFKVRVYNGISKITPMADFLNTRQYLQMRKEAFRNDAVDPTITNAPDLLVWDTTRYTDFKKLLIGGTAHTTDVQSSLSGGDSRTQFLIGGGYHRETTVYPGDMADNRGSVHLNVNHNSFDRKLSIYLTASYSLDRNHLVPGDPANLLNLPPDLPPLYDSTGRLNWQEGGVSFSNPLSFLYEKYSAKTDNLISSFQLGYKVIPDLKLKINIGYNSMHVNEINLFPKAAQDPQLNGMGASEFAFKYLDSWIIEPQAEYHKTINKGIIDILVGGTWQQSINNSDYIHARGYTNDALLESINSAATLDATSNYRQYRYNAAFGRINYNWNNKYIINLTGRRDGSSRFGPGKRFSNFGATGIAWIFSNEDVIKTALPFLSYGKLRGSYGTTGNDQIGDYQYLSSWKATHFPFQAASGLYPVNLFNPEYSWEINRKLEGALELGFFHDRLLLSGTYFRNRSSNELINYKLPTQVGFTGIIQNFPAVIENTGFEFQLITQNLRTRYFKWTTSFNLSIPRNKLISFPGLSTSSYAATYIVGESLSVQKGYLGMGVDPSTGIYQFKDINKDGDIRYPDDYIAIGNFDPKFYGSLDNAVTYRGFELDFFFEFRKQSGRNYFASVYNSAIGRGPGIGPVNQPSLVLNRWMNAGDETGIQKFTANSGTDAYNAIRDIDYSSAIIGDASFIRLKNLSLSYRLASSWIERMQMKSARIYLQGQNVLTITHYKGTDPETQNLYRLPPLITIVAGIQFSF